MRLKQLYKSYTIDRLVEEYKKTHDELVFSILYSRIVALISKLLAKINEGIDDIEDFIVYFHERLIHIIDGFDADKGKFLTYVSTAIKNDYTNYILYKSRKKRKPIAIYNIDDYENKLYHYVDLYNDSRILDLKIALDMLTQRQRELLYLRYNEGFSLREIAEIYQTTTHYIKKDLQNAEETIKKRLR